MSFFIKTKHMHTNMFFLKNLVNQQWKSIKLKDFLIAEEFDIPHTKCILKYDAGGMDYCPKYNNRTAPLIIHHPVNHNLNTQNLLYLNRHKSIK